MIYNPGDKMNQLVCHLSLYKRRRNVDYHEILRFHIFIQISGTIWEKDLEVTDNISKCLLY